MYIYQCWYAYRVHAYMFGSMYVYMRVYMNVSMYIVNRVKAHVYLNLYK